MQQLNLRYRVYLAERGSGDPPSSQYYVSLNQLGKGTWHTVPTYIIELFATKEGKEFLVANLYSFGFPNTRELELLVVLGLQRQRNRFQQQERHETLRLSEGESETHVKT